MYKRLFDIVFSFLGALTLMPLFAVLCLVSAVVYKGNVFFLQKRIGYRNRIFTIFKLRTMHDGKDSEGKLLADTERLNPYGKFLRTFSLDEIPQILNVLKGDLSIIGPRPLLVEYMDYFTEKEMVRHSIKPGLTGLAQVKGRNDIAWNKRFEYDIYYVKNQSFQLDLDILLQTVIHVLKGQQMHMSSTLIEERNNTYTSNE